MITLAFLDTETTGLDPVRHEPWEIALIIRGHHRAEWDGEWVFQRAADLGRADAAALDIGRYWQRSAVTNPLHTGVLVMLTPSGVPLTSDPSVLRDSPNALPESMSDTRLAHLLCELLAGAVVVGSNPDFDLRMLAKLLRTAGVPAPWHYRPIDVVTLAAGFQLYSDHVRDAPNPQLLPLRSEGLSLAQGVALPAGDERHTALGDARWVQRWYDQLTRLPGEG